MPDLPASQLRDSIGELSPPALSGENGEKYLYNIGLGSDVLLDKLNQAMFAHMPGYCPPSALPFLGRDRVLSQGPFETNAAFSARLSSANDAWQRAGSNRSVMAQALNYFAGFALASTAYTPRGTTAYVSAGGTYANWDTYYASSDLTMPPAHVRVTTTNWDFDGNLDAWWREWLILIFPPGSTLTNDGTWDDTATSTWDEDEAVGSWGLSITPDVLVSFRALVRLWKTANAFYPWFIFDLSANDGTPGFMGPNSVQGTGNPDGTWGRWGVTIDGVYQASRPDTAVFCDGTGIRVNCYEPTDT